MLKYIFMRVLVSSAERARGEASILTERLEEVIRSLGHSPVSMYFDKPEIQKGDIALVVASAPALQIGREFERVRASGVPTLFIHPTDYNPAELEVVKSLTPSGSLVVYSSYQDHESAVGTIRAYVMLSSIE